VYKRQIHGIRDEGGFESALSAAENRYYYETEDLAKLAATYAYHLSQAHAFLDGNKRIAAAVAGIFLLMNDARLNTSNEEIIKIFLHIADGKLSREDVEDKFAAWLILNENE
jgi:death-on-curing protein